MQTTQANRPVTAYHEMMIDKTLFRITSVFKGEIDLKTALEDLTVSKVARETLLSMEKN